METGSYLILDFGGTKLTAATIGPGENSWRARARRLSGPNPTAERDLALMFSQARDLLTGIRPMGVGVSFGGPVNFNEGLVHTSPHVPGWEEVPLQRLIEDEFGAPSLVENDGNAAALGELYYGAGRDVDSFLYITVSTGVGGGWILNRRPWRGAGQLAGEIGHTVVNPNGPLCLCGKRGCVERFASGPFIALDVRNKLRDEPEQGKLIRDLVHGNLEAIDGKTVAEAARRGDEVAHARLELAGWAVGRGIGNAANLINPQRFLLGGGITKSGPIFWEKVLEAAAETALPEVVIEIRLAELGDDAPLWGALKLAMGAAGAR